MEFRASFADLGIVANQTLRMYVASIEGETQIDRAPDTGDIQWSPVNIMGYALLGAFVLIGSAIIQRMKGRYARARA